MTEIVNVSPTLIIGLGGTGSYALQHVKRKIRRRLEAYNHTRRPLPRHIPFIEYLVIDTTAQEEMLEEFVPDEFMNIGRLNISRIIAELEQDSDSHIQGWFPKKLDPGQIDSGAGGVRHIGRLCFFVKQAEIQAALIGKINTIANYTNIRHFVSEHLPGLRYEENSTVDVHIVSSLCGGTGSACLLDTAYLVRHVIADKLQQQPNTSAHLITPEPFEAEPGVGRTTTEYIQSNFAVALSEVEHFTQKDAPRPWEVVYKNGTRVSSREKPFSTAYLLGWKEGGSLSKEHVCEIVGEAIAIKTVHPEGRRIKGIIENYKPHVINTEDARQKRRTYSSYNARILDLGVGPELFDSVVGVASRAVLGSLCDGDVKPEEATEALREYEEKVFAKETGLRGPNFEDFRTALGSEVVVTPDMYADVRLVLRGVSTVKSWTAKGTEARAASLANKVVLATEEQNQAVRDAKETFLLKWEERFRALRDATDAWVNGLLSERSLDYAATLLENVSARLTAFNSELDAYRGTLPDPQGDLYKEITQACVSGSVGGVPGKCADRARAIAYGEILADVSRHVTLFYNAVNSRAAWCRTARLCLEEARDKLPSGRRFVAASNTTSFAWTQDALEQLVERYKGKFVGRFLKLLEEKYDRNSKSLGVSPKVGFLALLDKKFGPAAADAKELAQAAARETLKAEIEEAGAVKREEALRSVHEFVQLASPPWQIRRLGEDIASASVTTCPRDSPSGQIMERSGKNINFSRNGSGGDEIMIFCSEHGVSVNNLIKFRQCLMAVDRKLRSEGKERMSDLSLDPKGWNIATPLPIERERERLRLYFSLAIRLGVIEREADEYTFKTASGDVVELRSRSGDGQRVKRYEAFESLLDLDCDGSEACAHFRRALREEITRRRKKGQIGAFRAELAAHRAELERLMAEADEDGDAPERNHLGKEIAAVQAQLDDVDSVLRGMAGDVMAGDGDAGAEGRGEAAGGAGRDGDAG
ncbi:MAG TPA: tubulin-like doman-containing protein [Pyrinomonadaceae bacterium]|jgi:hypothetical protein